MPASKGELLSSKVDNYNCIFHPTSEIWRLVSCIHLAGKKERKKKTKVKCSLIPFSLMSVLQNRRYKQAAEIRNVASGTVCMRNSDVIRKGEFLVCTLCLLHLLFLPQRWAEKTPGYFQQDCINPPINAQENIPTRGQVAHTRWQVSSVTVLVYNQVTLRA